MTLATSDGKPRRLQLTKRQKKWIKIAAIASTFTLPGIAAIWYTLTPTVQEPIPFDIVRPEIPTIDQGWENNPVYCDQQDIDPCYQQLTLRLWNNDPDAGKAGLIQEMVAREAARMRTRAVREQANPENPKCFNNSLEICFNSIAGNVLNEYQNAVTDIDKAIALLRYAALNQARFGGGMFTTPNRFGPLAAMENFENQLARHYGLSEKAARQQLEHGEKIQYFETQGEQ